MKPLAVHQPTVNSLTHARDQFRQLLEEDAVEGMWQSFFAENPFVLSSALPLRVEPQDITPLGRPGRSEADLIFFQRSAREMISFGVIELKRSNEPVIILPRRNIVQLSANATTAMLQAKHYASSLEALERAIFLGSKKHLFVVMGLSSELERKLTSDLLRTQARNLVPPGVQILGYDTVLSRFEETLPLKILSLAPAQASLTDSIQRRAEWCLEGNGASEILGRWNALDGLLERKRCLRFFVERLLLEDSSGTNRQSFCALLCEHSATDREQAEHWWEETLGGFSPTDRLDVGNWPKADAALLPSWFGTVFLRSLQRHMNFAWRGRISSWPRSAPWYDARMLDEATLYAAWQAHTR